MVVSDQSSAIMINYWLFEYIHVPNIFVIALDMYLPN